MGPHQIEKDIKIFHRRLLKKLLKEITKEDMKRKLLRRSGYLDFVPALKLNRNVLSTLLGHLTLRTSDIHPLFN